MKREDEINQIINKGNKVEVILNDETFREAVNNVNQRILAQWQTAKSTEEREQKWYLMQALKTILQELQLPSLLKNQALAELSQTQQTEKVDDYQW